MFRMLYVVLIFLFMNGLTSSMIHISDLESLTDEKISIYIENIKPQSEVTLQLSTKDKFDHAWKSRATFQASDKGLVDLSKQAPLKGSYDHTDPMGLFWSMSSQTMPSMYIPPENEISYTLEVFEGATLLASTEFKRLLHKDIEVKHIVENDLNVLVCIPKTQKTQTFVVNLTGSNGGLSPERAKLLASHGIPSCALAYFSEENVPKFLEEIPLEYVVNAIEKLKNYYPKLFNKVVLFGKSKGGELSLCLGSYFPDLFDGIIAAVPSSYVWTSPTDNNKSSWSLKGTPLPFIPAPKGLNKEMLQDLTKVHLKAIAEIAKNHEEAAIPVENIKCPLLVITVEDDKMWPSKYFGEQLDKLLHGKDHYTHICYEKAGHILTPPYFPTTSSKYWHGILKQFMETGGTPFEHHEACLDSWSKVKTFIMEL